MSKIKFAIVGTGDIAPTYVKSFKELSDFGELVLGIDTNPQVAQKFSDAFGIECISSLPQALDRKDIHAFIIATPSGLHVKQCLECIDAGKHVLIEKPLDINMEMVQKCINVKKNTDRKIGVMFQNRFKPASYVFKNLISSGVLGPLTFGEMICKWYRPEKYYQAASWRTEEFSGGGVLMNQAIHFIDLLCWFMGPVTKVKGTCTINKENLNVEDTAGAVLTFKSGAIGLIGATTTDKSRQGVQIGIVGNNGSLTYDLIGFLSAKYDSFKFEGKPLVDVLNHKIGECQLPYQSFVYVLWDFIDAINTGREPQIDIHQGKNTVEVIDAIYKSNKSGSEIIIDHSK